MRTKENGEASLKLRSYLLSGSFPFSFIPPVMKYFGLSETPYDFQVIRKNAVISGITFEKIDTPKEKIISVAVTNIFHKLSANTGHVHVLCAYKDDCECIKKDLEKERISVDVMTGDTDEEGKISIVKRWTDGRLKVLITTTSGIVGNESDHANHIIMVHPMYNIASFVQGVGRLRENKRNEKSSVTQIMANDSSYGEMRESSEKKIIKELQNRIVRAAGVDVRQS